MRKRINWKMPILLNLWRRYFASLVESSILHLYLHTTIVTRRINPRSASWNQLTLNMLYLKYTITTEMAGGIMEAGQIYNGSLATGFLRKTLNQHELGCLKMRETRTFRPLSSRSLLGRNSRRNLKVPRETAKRCFTGGKRRSSWTR
jgi:hypothetical protein